MRIPRAPGLAPLSAPPASYTAAVEPYLTGAGSAKSSARIYRISLTTWGGTGYRAGRRHRRTARGLEQRHPVPGLRAGSTEVI